MKEEHLPPRNPRTCTMRAVNGVEQHLLSLCILLPVTEGKNRGENECIHNTDESDHCAFECDENELPQLKAESQLTRSSKAIAL